MDTVAPLRTKKIRIRVNAEWYNDAIRSEKQSRRRAERRWLKTKSLVDRASYKVARLKVHEMIDEAKRTYYQGKVTACDGDSKKLFRVVDTLLGKSTASPLPVSESLRDLASQFHRSLHRASTRCVSPTI